MASNYPGSVDSFDTIASDKKTSDVVGGRTHRQMHNDLGDAIEAVQGELGANPSGSDATVAARLTAIEAGTNLATGSVTSAKIADGTIVNADINSSAAIDRTKLAQPAYSVKTSAYTATTADDVLNVTSGTFTLDLPAASTCAGKTLRVKNSGTGVVTLDGNSSETIETVATFPLGPGSYVEITSTGSAWILTGGLAGTGWRNVTADMEAAFKTSNPNATLLVRRVGATVAWLLNEPIAGSATGSVPILASIPSGFRSYSASIAGYVLINPNNGLPLPGECLYFSNDSITGFGWTAVRHMVQATCTTTNAWPTSLPGTAA